MPSPYERASKADDPLPAKDDPLAVEVVDLARRCDPVPDAVVEAAKAVFAAREETPEPEDREDAQPSVRNGKSSQVESKLQPDRER